MVIQVSKNPMLDAIFKAVFNDKAFKKALPQEKLRAISEAGKIAGGLIAADPEGKIEFSVSC
jgi:hypothetical protein